MANVDIKFSLPSTEASVTPATTVTQSLADGSEGTTFVLPNDTNRNLYYKVRLSLASLTPTAGASVSLVQYGPNTSSAPSAQRATEQGAGGKIIKTETVTVATEAKSIEFLHIIVPPFGMEYSFINNMGVTWPASGNDVLEQHYGEIGEGTA